jgi:putative transposase
MCLHRGPAPQAQRTHKRWNMDFVHDQLFDGRPFRMLTVVDQFSRLSPALAPRHSFGGGDVATVLDRVIARTGAPTDDGHIEYLGRQFRDECLNVTHFLSIDDAKARI